MTRKIYLYFALTCLLGVIMGAAGAVYFAWHTGRWHRPFNRERMVRRLSRDLQLSPPQVQRLRQIMEESGAKYRDLQKEEEPRYQAIREEARGKIRQMLNPDQVAKFDELAKRWDEMRRRRGPPQGR